MEWMKRYNKRGVKKMMDKEVVRLENSVKEEVMSKERIYRKVDEIKLDLIRRRI